MHSPLPVRLALLWHDTVLTERRITRGPVTVGEALDNTLCVPATAELGERHPLLEPGGGAWMLFPTAAMAGRLQVGGRERSLAEVPTPVLRDGDWAHLDLGPYALFVQAGGEEPARLGGPATRVETPVLGGLAAALSLHLGVLIAAFLLYDEAPRLTPLDLADRQVRITSMEAPMQEKEPPPIAEETLDDPGKRAAREEGKFGEPDRKVPTRLARREGDLVKEIKQVGVHKALGSNLLGRGPLKSVFGDKQGFDSKLNHAIAGPDGPLVEGHGSRGMGLRGVRDGGGGDGFGRIGGMGTVDLGGGPGVRSTLKGKPKRPPIVDIQRPGPGDVGQFCKEAEVQRVVAARRGGVQHCYDRALAGNPELAGKLSLVWRIGLDGSVAHVAVENSTLGNRDVEACVARAVRTWKFPAPDGGMCQIRYPFVFSAGL